MTISRRCEEWRRSVSFARSSLQVACLAVIAWPTLIGSASPQAWLAALLGWMILTLAWVDWARPPPGAVARRLPARDMDQRGFSLLEVMVALVIAGIAFAVLLRTATESLVATAAAGHYQEAVTRARSHLDSVTANPAAVDQEGDDGGGYRWRILARAIDSTGKQDSAGRPVPDAGALVVTLYAATVWITWLEGSHSRAVRLDSECLLTSAPS